MTDKNKPEQRSPLKRAPYYILDRGKDMSTGTKIAIGAGAITVAGIATYEIINALSGTACSNPSSPCGKSISTCNQQMQAAYRNYTNYSNQFIQEDAADGVPMSGAQLSYLQTFLNEANTAAQCIAGITKANGQSPLDIIATYAGKAILLALTIAVGVRGAAYIIAKYYNGKTPPKPPTNGSGGGGILYGLIDYLKATGVVPVTWNASGISTVNSTIPMLENEAQALVITLENNAIITEAAGAAVIAAETAAISEEASILLAVMA
jgi:hypothetical protein